jgi:hypothetical protein
MGWYTINNKKKYKNAPKKWMEKPYIDWYNY